MVSLLGTVESSKQTERKVIEIINTCTVNQEDQYFFPTNLVEAVREFFLIVCYKSA